MDPLIDPGALPVTTRRNLNVYLASIGVLAAAAIPAALVFLGGDWVNRRSVITAYIGTAATLIALFALLTALDEVLHRRIPWAIRDLPAAYVALVVPWTCLLAGLTAADRLPWQGYAAAAAGIHTMFLLIWIFNRTRTAAAAITTKWNPRVISLLPLFFGGIFWCLFGRYYRLSISARSLAVLAAMCAGIAALFLADGRKEGRPKAKTRWWVYVLVGLLLFGLTYQPEIPFDRHHSNPILAPVHDVMHGGTLFVDTFSQYGVGIVYFLLAAFRILRLPVSFPGLGLLLNALYVLQFGLFFLLLQKATKNLSLSLAGLGAILYFTYLAVAWPTMLAVPAQGPLRYGLAYLLLAVGWLTHFRAWKGWRLLELILLGMAALWSLEAFVVSFFSLNTLHGIADILYSESRKEGWAVFRRRLLMQSGAAVFSASLWWAGSTASTGRMPDPGYFFGIWDHFLSAQRYSNDAGFYSLWTGAFTAVYLGTILAVLFAGRTRPSSLPKETGILLAGLSTAGLLEHLYFFVYGLDFHLALVCTPLLLVIVLWLSVLQRDSFVRFFPPAGRWSIGMAIAVSVWICLIQINPWFFSGVQNTLMHKILRELPAGKSITFRNPYQTPPANETVAAFADLVGKYAAEDRSIALFAHYDDQVEILLLTEKTHLLEITDPIMCSLSPGFSAHILDLARKHAGEPEYLFYDSAEGALLTLQRQAFEILLSGAEYAVVDRRSTIMVYRKA
ncbi:MAG: hypothetical protein JW929_06195 [Anaerolineales bacterium]|nr:hypothetical protein [Anaerolineales bacterium]